MKNTFVIIHLYNFFQYMIKEFSNQISILLILKSQKHYSFVTEGIKVFFEILYST